MVVTELDSFVQKCHQLWSAGISAHLETHAGRVWVGLRAQLGHAPGHLHHHPRPQFPQPPRKQESTSRQRRRARREAARKIKVGEVPIVQDVAEEALDAVEAERNEVANDAEETEINENNKSESSDHIDLNDKTLIDTAEKECIKEDMTVADELCPDEDFENATPSAKPRSICSVELFPVKYKLDRLEEFRETIENYFKNRKDVIERVIKCEVVNHGNNVKLVTEMKVERGWIFFYGDPEENYPDLEGIRSVRHSCQDLRYCGG
jgi:hypothetical protein